MTTARYRIRRKLNMDPIPDAQHEGGVAVPYGIWDTQDRRWVDKFGRPDNAYWTCCRDVALMRRRDLTQYTKEAAR